MIPFKRHADVRVRMRGFSCSNIMWNRILRVTKGTISASSFIRRAVEKELVRWENGKGD